MQTAFTERFGIRVPIANAPMSGVAGGALAAAVCQAGGLGLLGHAERQLLDKEVLIARTLLGLSTEDRLPIGFGILAFQIETSPEKSTAYLKQLVALRPHAIWISFGRHIKSHVLEIRAIEKKLGSKERIQIMIQVGTVPYGIEAAGWDIDALVAQGTEAGGHGNTLATGLPLLSLLPLLHRHLSKLPSPPLLLSAGGLATGQHLLSILPFSSGMVVGTAFLASPESLYFPQHKRRVLAATGEETRRTLVFDRINGWDKFFGENIDGRAIGNLMTRDEDAGVGDEDLAERYQAAKEGGDREMQRLVVWAGTGVGLVNAELPAREIVERIVAEAAAGLKTFSGLQN